MTGFALMGEYSIDSNAIVSHADGEVPTIAQCDLQSLAVRVFIGIANGLVTDSVNLVSHDRMQFLRGADHGERCLHATQHATLFRRPPERVGKIVSLCARG